MSDFRAINDLLGAAFLIAVFVGLAFWLLFSPRTLMGTAIIFVGVPALWVLGVGMSIKVGQTLSGSAGAAIGSIVGVGLAFLVTTRVMNAWQRRDAKGPRSPPTGDSPPRPAGLDPAPHFRDLALLTYAHSVDLTYEQAVLLRQLGIVKREQSFHVAGRKFASLGEAVSFAQPTQSALAVRG